MENKSYFGVQGVITNESNEPLLIKSLDYPEYNNQEIPPGFTSAVLTFIYPTDLKLRKEYYHNTVSFTLVDKDF